MASIHRDDMAFIKNVFSVSIGTDFETYKEMITHMASDRLYGEDEGPQYMTAEERKAARHGQLGSAADAVASTLTAAQRKAFRTGKRPSAQQPTVSPEIAKILEDAGEKDRAERPVYYTKKKLRDTRLGGNDVINPYPQYCKNDDIVHPFYKTPFGDNAGMGRVYSEQLDDKKQQLHITVGLPEYNSMTSFYTNVFNSKLASLMADGTKFSFSDVGHLLGTAVGTFVTLPFIPLQILNWALEKASTTKITKYFDLRPEMFLYYRMVNTIIVHLAVNMGLAKDGSLSVGAVNNTGSITNNKSQLELARNVQEEGGNGDPVSLPDIFQKSGWDIFKIMHRKYMYMFEGNEINDPAFSTDSMLLDQMAFFKRNEHMQSQDDSKEKSWWDDMFWGFKGTLYDGNLYVSFLVEKSVDTSESLSNQTGESPVGQKLKSAQQNAAQIKNAMFHGNLGSGAIAGTIESIMGGLTGIAKGLTDTLGFDGASHLLTGSGYVDVPEVWTDSSMSKDYSFQMELKATCGNPYAIMQQIYIPLALILGMSFPRATGSNSYTSPFMVKAYCKGMLATPLGIIDSVTINRGGDQHGWTLEKLPTKISVNFTIKDLSPAMYMGLGSDAFLDALGETSAFNEYLMTLSGMGLKERMTMMRRIKRQFEIMWDQLYKNRLSPLSFGVGLASTPPGRLLGAISPGTLRPTE